MVLLDTSFFIRFLNDADPLFGNANSYYKYFLQNQIPMKISTISIAEFCFKGNPEELPLRHLQILPFNYSHAVKAGELGKISFTKELKSDVKQRMIIPNDTKLFAQAEIENIKYFLTSDMESEKVFKYIEGKTSLNFKIINLNTPVSQTFGILFPETLG